MFELEIESSKDDKNFAVERLTMLKKIIESLADIVDQMEIKANEKGLAIQVMDSMHVALVDIFMRKEIFSKFRCDRDIHLGVPIKNLLTILRGITLEETSVLRFSCEDKPETLKIEHTMANSYYVFDVTLYEIGTANYSVPQLEYDSVARMPCEQFRTITKNIGSFGEYISLNCEKDRFSFRQTGDLTKSAMTLLSDSSSVSVDCSEAVKVEIAMKYINLVNKVSYLSNALSINLGTTAPAFFEVRLYDTLGQIRFYVAPKVDNN
ncbi:proliferating cell nuclear antigen [Pancytospora philotis]|nr:proliferating cell nuclear antigen [Pancytospora philotis]